MLFSDSYFTISGASEAMVKEKGSKFMAFAFPVSSEAGIREHLAALKKAHPSASHHCYAWRLGADKAAYRANDDGEPSNSAGKPILSQIQANDLSNVLIVVVRYFGGTLLGVGGLISAYKAAAQAALAAASIEERFILFEYTAEFGFDDMNRVMRILKENEAAVVSTSYEETNRLIFRIKKINSERTELSFKDLYTSKLTFIKTI
jgi:uncharacterized YigZ family protein